MSTTSWHPQLRHKKTNDRNYTFLFTFEMLQNVKVCFSTKVIAQVRLISWHSDVHAIWYLLTFSEHRACCQGAALHCCSMCKPQSLKEWHLSNRTSVGADAVFFSFISCFTRTKYHKPHLQPPTQFVFFIFSLQRSSVKIRDGGNLN